MEEVPTFFRWAVLIWAACVGGVLVCFLWMVVSEMIRDIQIWCKNRSESR